MYSLASAEASFSMLVSTMMNALLRGASPSAPLSPATTAPDTANRVNAISFFIIHLQVINDHPSSPGRMQHISSDCTVDSRIVDPYAKKNSP